MSTERTARLGDIVYWYPGADINEQPHVAVVLNQGETSLCVGILSHTSYSVQPKDGVRHVHDKRAKHPELMEAGGWDYTEQHKEHLELLERVALLEETVNLLTESHNQPALN